MAFLRAVVVSKMFVPCEKWRWRRIETPWSSEVTIDRFICTISNENREFYGVSAHNELTGSYGLTELTDQEILLWVVKDGLIFRLWQECRQRPRTIDGEPDGVIQNILGHYEALSGVTHYAIQWVGYESPTWEAESELKTCGKLLLAYWRHYSGLENKVKQFRNEQEK